jgi:hypothetical protein
MKILLILIFLIPLKIISQLPLFNSNTNKDDSLNSIILGPEFDKYDFLISYEANSYWTRYNSNLNILANKKNKWYCINIQKTYKQDTIYKIDYEHPLNISVKKRRVSQFKIKKIIKTFDENRIWNLEIDSLNIDYRSITSSKNDTTPEVTEVLMITDCTNYSLKFKSKSSFRIVSAYCPYYFLEKMPEIKVRQNFINCFESLNSIGRKFILFRKA